MTKKDMLINFVAAMFFLIILFVNNVIYNINNLEIKLIIQLISGIVFLFFAFLKLKKVNLIVQSVEFLYDFLFFSYSIIGPAVFFLDKCTARYYYFTMNEGSMSNTLAVYINIFAILNILFFTLNRFKNNNVNEKIQKLSEKASNLNLKLNLFDLVAVFCSFFSLFKLIAYGPEFYSLSTLAKREILNTGFTHYIGLYMVVYSLFVSLNFALKGKKGLFYRTRLIILIIYWGIFLTCERRIFVIFCLGFIMLFIYRQTKIKLRYIFLTGVCTILLMFATAVRENVNFNRNDFTDVLYMSTTEFYCTFSITNAYIVNPPKLLNGRTYVYDTISKFFPRAIFSNKPDDLSQIFKKQYNLKVGFAYNPIAEGILNFGGMAVFMVPLIVLFLTIIANKLSNKNILFYIIIAISSFDFYRGPFSNFIFDIVFSIFMLIFIFNFSKRGV